MRMYDKIYNMKFLPPGRGLWAMGTKLTDERELYAALNNCAFVSTAQPNVKEFIGAFEFLMDSSMLGIGVGFDTKGKGIYKIYKPKGEETFVIPDTREGWVESLKILLNSYLVQD
jgi:ribonucleoside-triphosphate reductase (thioredoxin)